MCTLSSTALPARQHCLLILLLNLAVFVVADEGEIEKCDEQTGDHAQENQVAEDGHADRDGKKQDPRVPGFS